MGLVTGKDRWWQPDSGAYGESPTAADMAAYHKQKQAVWGGRLIIIIYIPNNQEVPLAETKSTSYGVLGVKAFLNVLDAVRS